jgi:hypothetical protein
MHKSENQNAKAGKKKQHKAKENKVQQKILVANLQSNHELNPAIKTPAIIDMRKKKNYDLF